MKGRPGSIATGLPTLPLSIGAVVCALLTSVAKASSDASDGLESSFGFNPWQEWGLPSRGYFWAITGLLIAILFYTPALVLMWWRVRSASVDRGDGNFCCAACAPVVDKDTAADTILRSILVFYLPVIAFAVVMTLIGWAAGLRIGGLLEVFTGVVWVVAITLIVRAGCWRVSKPFACCCCPGDRDGSK